MTKRKKLVISIFLGVFGLSLSFISYVIQNEMWHGVVFGLGVSVVTAAMLDIYEYIMDYSKDDAILQFTGLVDLDYNENSNSQGNIYKNAKSLRIILSAGTITFRKYQRAITESILQNNCNVQVILSNSSLLKSGMYMAKEDETDIAYEIIQDIIRDITDREHVGGIELRYSAIAPIGSVEIKDDNYCVVVPYIYKHYRNDVYHATYRNTRNSNDIYHMWVNHFEKVWEEGTTVLKYPQ